jgi:hypothetical protein
MPYLLARASEVALETQQLRRVGRALRLQAAISASELGRTVQRIQMAAGNTQRESNWEEPPSGPDETPAV